MSSPAVLNVLRFGWSEILKNRLFSYIFEGKVNKTIVFITFSSMSNDPRQLRLLDLGV